MDANVTFWVTCPLTKILTDPLFHIFEHENRGYGWSQKWSVQVMGCSVTLIPDVIVTVIKSNKIGFLFAQITSYLAKMTLLDLLS